ncbi:TetR/AcrR family transcriptional regulator [Ferrimonas lipolytica]|uniref:TetR/AcrR family transcriptional regulator n=1 Tax=Ferrimonas lipolytica TaxID=2724191 RepID=A0A6H1UAX8_9GAMM|nr:TetR/AcrR family transcriptional regulator [Ferrimonas lipolytica]QIZ75513.1 TetR/AcrR family transcriptional regulator [Ferrimonas lipolytica]
MTTMETNSSMSWGSPNQARFRQRDQVLVRLAEKLLKEQGLVSFRFSELAPLAGCSAGTLYKHFSSKEDLLIAIFAHHIEHLVERQPHLMSCDLSFAERWVAMHLLSVLASQRSSWTIGINGLGGAPKVLDRATEYRVQELKMYLDQFYHAILRVVEGARIQGELSATDEQVSLVHSMLTYVERGACGILGNELMSNAVKPLDSRQIFDACAIYINSLNWNAPLRADSYERVMAEVEHQLAECERERELVNAL